MQENYFSPGPMTRNRRKSVGSAIKPTPVKDKAAIVEALASRLSPELQKLEVVSSINSEPAKPRSFTSKMTSPFFIIAGTVLALVAIIVLVMLGLGTSPQAQPELGGLGVRTPGPASAGHDAMPDSSAPRLDAVSQLEAQIQQLEVWHR